MKEKAILTIVISALMIVAIFAAIPVKAPFKGQIKIGIIGPVGLPHWSPAGMKPAAEIAAAEINAAGGVRLSDGDYEIVLAFGNEKSLPPDPTGAALEVERLINVEGCEFIIGGFRSEVTGAMIEMAMDYKVPFFINGAATNAFCNDTVPKNYARYKYLFRINPVNDTMLLRTIAGGLQYLIGTKLLPLYGTKLWPDAPNPQVRVAVVVEDLLWTAGMYLYFSHPAYYPMFLGPYANVTYAGKIPDGTTDCTTWLTAIKASKARVMLHIFSGVTGVPLIMQWRALNVSAIPVGINVMAQLQGHWSTTGGTCEYESILAFGGTRTPIIPGKTEVFWDKFVNYTGGYWPIYTAFGAYNGIYSLKEALEAIGSKNKDALVAYYENPAYQTLVVNGIFKFDSTHDVFSNEPGPTWTQGYTRAMMVQWLAGRMEVVSPMDQVNYSKRWAIPHWMYPLRTDLTGPATPFAPDGKVDMRDIGVASKAFGSSPGHPRWEKEADINYDNKVDMKDIGAICKDFGTAITLPLP